MNTPPHSAGHSPSASSLSSLAHQSNPHPDICKPCELSSTRWRCANDTPNGRWNASKRGAIFVQGKSVGYIEGGTFPLPRLSPTSACAAFVVAFFLQSFCVIDYAFSYELVTPGRSLTWGARSWLESCGQVTACETTTMMTTTIPMKQWAMARSLCRRLAGGRGRLPLCQASAVSDLQTRNIPGAGVVRRRGEVVVADCN